MFSIRIIVPIGRKPNGELQAIDRVLKELGCTRSGDPKPEISTAGYVTIQVHNLQFSDVPRIHALKHVLSVRRGGS